MSRTQINLLEREMVKITNEINSNNNSQHINDLKKKQSAIKNELAKLRIKEFEEREYLDFDDDYR